MTDPHRATLLKFREQFESRFGFQVGGLYAEAYDCLLLIAKGLTNAEMASRMYVGEATVKTHVGNVLMKLGMRDRVQAVIFAYEHGVVSP